jgi:hypothetical protein
MPVNNIFSISSIKNMMLAEVSQVQGFMHLLMRPRNRMPWLPEDKALLIAHLKHTARALPILGIFALPGSILLLPLLALFLDRRQRARAPQESRDPSTAGQNSTDTGKMIR